MRKAPLFLFFVLINFAALAQTSNVETIVLSDTFCISPHKPLPFKAGSIIQTSCDSTYMINNMRFKLYERSVEIIRDKKYVNTCKVLMDNYEQRLAEQNKAFNKLYGDYIKLDSVSHNVIADTKNNLIQVNSTLVKAQTDITSVNVKMDQIKNTINEQRKKSFFDKILYGTGGVAVGILLGLLIVH
jgi:hypothetical protein